MLNEVSPDFRFLKENLTVMQGGFGYLKVESIPKRLGCSMDFFVGFWRDDFV